MTDNEIIKFMQCVIGNEVSCSECAYQKVLPFPSCRMMCAKNALDLINRQRVEIEKLKQKNEFFLKTITENAQRALEVAVEEIETAKSEAIKEFAERLKEKFGIADCIVTVNNNDIDELIEEMTEENEK